MGKTFFCSSTKQLDGWIGCIFNNLSYYLDHRLTFVVYSKRNVRRYMFSTHSFCSKSVVSLYLRYSSPLILMSFSPFQILWFWMGRILSNGPAVNPGHGLQGRIPSLKHHDTLQHDCAPFQMCNTCLWSLPRTGHHLLVRFVVELGPQFLHVTLHLGRRWPWM